MDSRIERLIDTIQKIFIGNTDAIKVCIAGLLAGGHVLIEDVPGIGKTVLSKTLARSIRASFHRIQFTPDMLPSDITGSSVYNQKTSEFEFMKGPVFADIVLADEINRTTPRTQSALLECMEEHQVTVEGVTRDIHGIFFVIATQNPIELHGVYPLPEAQLDRFIMQISLGYPSLDDEVRIVDCHSKTHTPHEISAVLNVNDIIEMQKEVEEIHFDDDLKEYAIRIVRATRENSIVSLGASPRASLALIRASKAFAYINGSDFVTPQIIKDAVVPVLSHRIVLSSQAVLNNTRPAHIITRICEGVEVPV